MVMAIDRDELKSLYLDTEKEFPILQEPPNKKIGDYDQHYRVLINLVAEVRERSLQEELTSDKYFDRVSTAIGLVRTLHGGISPRKPDSMFKCENEQYLWHHRSNEKILDFEGTHKGDMKEVDINEVHEAAFMYLSNPWLQHDPIDYFIIDSLLYFGTIGTREQIRSGFYRGKIDFVYSLASGEMRKVEIYKARLALLAFGLRYILPFAILGGLYVTDHKTALSIVGSIYAIYLFMRGITFPLRVYEEYYIKNNFDLEMESIFKSMQIAYRYWAPPIINLKIFRRTLDKLISEHVAFIDPVIFTLLGRLEEIHGETFIPFAKWESWCFKLSQ
jgi:hypothetical protein